MLDFEQVVILSTYGSTQKAASMSCNVICCRRVQNVPVIFYQYLSLVLSCSRRRFSEIACKGVLD